MIQAPEGPHGIVDDIVAILVSKFHPRRVYLFGSRVRGDAKPHSDYDFLIEVDERPEGVRITRQGLIWLRDFPDSEVQVHVRSTGQLERNKDDPGTVEWDVVREGRVLFELEGLPAIVPAYRGGKVRERYPDPPDSFRGWLVHAERDMRLATHLSSDFREWKEGICFHAQQAAEKFLKALLISQHERPAHTHELVPLLLQVRRLGFDLGALEDDAEFLSPFAVEVRYPEETEGSGGEIFRMAQPVDVTEAEARRAFEIARRIEAAVRRHLP